MPTSHERIPVVRDAALANALERIAPLVGSPPRATLVHDLAIRGARALLEDHRDDVEAIERLVARSTADEAPYDRDVLADVDRLAWRRW